MSRETAELLAEFEALPTSEKEAFVSEILRRFRSTETHVQRDSDISLHDHGIDQVQAANLRARLNTFAEDWERPEAAIYDENPPR